jgi:ribosome biogenesis GTPase
VAAAKKKAKKVRVAFHKNRNRRARQSDLTRQSAQDLDAVADLETGERLSGKGELSRYRTILTDDEEGSRQQQSELENCVPGRVLMAVGANQCRVQASSGQVYTCSVRRLLRTLTREARNAVVAGDRVFFSPMGPAEGVIERIEPRAGTLSRVSRNKAHLIVANVEQAVIVTSVAEPDLKPGLIDRFLCSTEKGGIRAIICINKIDLGRAAQLQPIVGQYSRIGYPVVLTNALTGEGIPQLRSLLQDRESVFTGQSGVGKSSLLNALQPGLSLATGSVSAETSKGRHTTRVTELLQLHSGGWVVDTPGIRQLQLWDVLKEEVEGLYVEFRPFVSRCRFPNCTHTHEIQCGIREAVEHGWISPLRYACYVRIVTGDE